MKNLHQSELSVQRGRTHRPGAFMELHEPFQGQTVATFGFETTDYSSFKSRLAQVKETSAEILADAFPKLENRWQGRKTYRKFITKSRGSVISSMA
jgi:hypothetical protein